MLILTSCTELSPASLWLMLQTRRPWRLCQRAICPQLSRFAPPKKTGFFFKIIIFDIILLKHRTTHLWISPLRQTSSASRATLCSSAALRSRPSPSGLFFLFIYFWFIIMALFLKNIFLTVIYFSPFLLTAKPPLSKSSGATKPQSTAHSCPTADLSHAPSRIWTRRSRALKSGRGRRWFCKKKINELFLGFF